MIVLFPTPILTPSHPCRRRQLSSTCICSLDSFTSSSRQYNQIHIQMHCTTTYRLSAGPHVDDRLGNSKVLKNKTIGDLIFYLRGSEIVRFQGWFALQSSQNCIYHDGLFYNENRTALIQMKLINAIFKQDPILRQLRKSNLMTDTLTTFAISNTLDIFLHNTNREQAYILAMIKQLDEKGASSKKFKIMLGLIEISKVTKYDICNIIVSKKIKMFSRPNRFKHNEIEPRTQNLQIYISEELVMPLYNYLMKLSTNQELYHTCKGGQIPYDDIFRRGSKIRFIWIFKIYNIINAIIPILESIIRINQFHPNLIFFSEAARFLSNDIVIMNNFVVKALEEASNDHYILMPYFDMLQFYESLNEQLSVGKKIRALFGSVQKFANELLEPHELSLKDEQVEDIQIQALRVRLISNSIKNPKRDHQILQTEYNERVQKKQRQSVRTEPDFQKQKQDFKQRWRNLD